MMFFFCVAGSMGLLASFIFALSLFHVGNTTEVRHVFCEDIKVDGGYKYEYTPFEGKIRANWNTNTPIAELNNGELDKTKDVVDMTDSYIITKECKDLLMEFKKVNALMFPIEYKVNSTKGTSHTDTSGFSWQLPVAVGGGIALVILSLVIGVVSYYCWWKRGASGRDFAGYVDFLKTRCQELCARRQRERRSRCNDGGPSERDPALTP
ncbi:uncharacterized protein LOC128751519 isoform X1 [Synchiropus splendidus]|uniref:uncharacterized protein LOC128751519 isoform X1 n=2 Tax=Synchiropus splendidus TaxID=270530 RepID=UPI00237EDAD7|nr:uncharacterized protein LOC128751519 isoform X1 [Synchiropus splendidus]